MHIRTFSQYSKLNIEKERRPKNLQWRQAAHCDPLNPVVKSHDAVRPCNWSVPPPLKLLQKDFILEELTKISDTDLEELIQIATDADFRLLQREKDDQKYRNNCPGNYFEIEIQIWTPR